MKMPTRLMQAGVPTELHVYPGAYHAAEAFVPDADHSKRFQRDQLSALSRALAVTTGDVVLGGMV